MKRWAIILVGAGTALSVRSPVLFAGLFLVAACGGSTAPSPSTKAEPIVTSEAPPEEVVATPSLPRSARQVTHGPASFEVTATTAVLWARTDRAATMHVDVTTIGAVPRHDTTTVDAARDFTGAITVTDLLPATEYLYRVWFAEDARIVPGEANRGTAGTFRTAPTSTDSRAVRFAWSGDLGGQNICRDQNLGYPLVASVAVSKPDLFVGLGDMIYADDECKPVGLYHNAQVPGPPPAVDLEGYRAHWRYNREDTGMAALLRSVAYFPVWDDHEVLNNFGPQRDTGKAPPFDPATHLMPIGLEAYLEYNPPALRTEASPPLYRRVRWGKHAEIFFLDTRRYRDLNRARDSATKTMLGKEQLAWFLDGIRKSDATWKIVVSGVPFSLVTSGDSWANGATKAGFETELGRIFQELHDAGSRNNLWITTDVHFTAAYRATPFSEDPGFAIYEVIAGPLSAGLGIVRPIDTTFHPVELWKRAAPAPPTTYEGVRDWFSFAVVDLDEAGKLTLEIDTEKGPLPDRLEVTPN